MVYIDSSQLSPEDIRHLGENVERAIERDHDELRAVNRSLACHNEALPPEVGELAPL